MTFIRTRLFGKKIVIFQEIDEAEEEEEDNFDCGAINSQFAQPKLKVLKIRVFQNKKIAHRKN